MNLRRGTGSRRGSGCFLALFLVLAMSLVPFGVAQVYADHVRPKIISVEHPVYVMSRTRFEIRVFFEYEFSSATEVKVNVVPGWYRNSWKISDELGTCNVKALVGRGSSSCSLTLTAPINQGSWLFTVYASRWDTINGKTQWWYDKSGARELTLHVGPPSKLALLTVRIGFSGATVRVDGNAKVTGLDGTAQFQVLIAQGRHSVQIPAEIDLGSGARAKFEAWSDGSPNTLLSFQVNGDMLVTAIYRTQYYLTLVSEYGSARGNGWYDAGSNAAFSIEETFGPALDGFLGTLGARYVFSGWTGNLSTSHQNVTIVMDEPKVVIAIWTPDYTLPALSLGIVGTIAAIGTAISWNLTTQRRRSSSREKSTYLQPSTPDPDVEKILRTIEKLDSVAGLIPDRLYSKLTAEYQEKIRIPEDSPR